MSSPGLCSYKDEVTELNLLLNDSQNQRNPAKYRELIKQVILYMTKGIDMTPLFATIVKAAATSDYVQKKLCNLYLCHCASSHPDLALLTVNTLKRDAADTNSTIRGLALRSMGSLRLPTLVEYIKDAMLKGCRDCSPYVRRTAMIGCLQLHKLAPEQIKVIDISEIFYRRLQRDKDIQVRKNALISLEELYFSSNGIAIPSSQAANFFLDKLPMFDDWGKQLVLSVLTRYSPQNEDEIYSMLNTIDVCLKHPNASVVLGAVRLFLHITSGMMALKNDIFNRIKVPLLTAMSTKSPEIVYTILCHIEVLLYKAPTLFEDKYSSFFCRYNDPVYLKIKKIEVLSNLVTESNGKQILGELSYHAKHTGTSSHSISNIGKIALLHPEMSDMCIDKLFSFLNWQDSHITSHTLTAFRDLIIKYDKCNALLPNISKHLKSDLLPDGKASTIWMLGEFGENILESPYVLESLIDGISEETSSLVKLELLAATVKLFFKRPPECQGMLGHLLEYCIEKEYHMDVRDRALLYYRLLEGDLAKAKEVICCPRSAQFIDSTNVIMIDSKETLFQEFNTLAVVYGQPSSSFVPEEILEKNNQTSQDECPPEDDNKQTRNDYLIDDNDSLNGSKSEEELVEYGSPVALELVEKPDLHHETFENLWRKLEETESYETELDAIPDQSKFQSSLANRRIYTMASTPPDAEQIRYFFYAQASGFILCEVTLDTTSKVLKSVIKMEEPSQVHSFIELFQNCLLDKSVT